MQYTDFQEAYKQNSIKIISDFTKGQKRPTRQPGTLLFVSKGVF